MKATPDIRAYLAEIGRKGGSVRSKAQKAAARDNAKYGKDGGRPRLYPPCQKYRRKSGEPGSHRFSKAGVCHGCGFRRQVDNTPRKVAKVSA